MWNELKISEQTYFIHCNFSEKSNDVTFMLYDFKITWYQTVNLEDVKHKVKLLNKRFDFNEDNIKEALTRDAIESAVLEEATNMECCSLKLKYRVKNCLLSYEWCLRKQNLLEFQQTIVRPLLLALLESQQQIQILADSVRKKDIELKQFHIEGAVLNRKTLATKPFDFDDFNAKFENWSKTTKHFEELAKCVKGTERNTELEVINKNSIEGRSERNVKSDENMREDQRSSLKISPRQKKRKTNETKMEQLQQHLKLCRKGLEYESSQSQTPSAGSSQIIEESEMKKFKATVAKDGKTKTENIFSPRKSTRCSTLKQKEQKMSSDDKTDSDYGDHLRTPTQKNATKCLNGRRTVSSTNRSYQTTKANPENIPRQEIKQVKLKAIRLLNNTRKEAADESIDANVFDFITESDDERTLLKRNKSLENKREQNSQKSSSKNRTRSTSLPMNKSAVFDLESVNSTKPHSVNNSLTPSSTPVIINEISSQLDNIKKELETLEAMRLADLKLRMCKA